MCTDPTVAEPTVRSNYTKIIMESSPYAAVEWESFSCKSFASILIVHATTWHYDIDPFHFQSCCLLNLRPYLAPREKWSPDYGSASDAAAWVTVSSISSVSTVATGTTKCATECEVRQSCKVSCWKRTCASPSFQTLHSRDGNLGQAETADLQQKVSQQQEELLQACKISHLILIIYDHLISA